MLKHLTLALSVAALLPACTIISDDSASDTNNSSNATSTAGTTTAGDTTNPTTSTTGGSATTGQTSGQTTGQTAESTASDATTDVPTTDGTTGQTTSQTTGMTTGMTTGQTTGETTGGGLYGKCGWDAANNYYACEVDGGVGSLEGDSPIACDPGIEEGTKCTEDGPVTGAGCCTTEGVLYYCDSDGAMTVFKQECGV